MAEQESKKVIKVIKKEPTVIDTWNDVVEQMERLQVLWKRHQKMGVAKLAELPPEAQRVFAHVVHKQKFEFMLDFMKRYVRLGLDQLKIKTEEDK